MTTISLNGGLIRNNLNILIEGEYCETYMNGLSYVKGKTHMDHHTLADHRKPNSYSNELYKGLYDENSTGVFNGKIYVRQNAQKTNAYQQNRNVLLSEKASVYTKPQLEIWADDVKCSHGATTGKLDETALFYMRARGISEAEARKLLLKAFANEVIEKIEVEELKEYVENLI
jgi:Fe-S cluster assembly protein SufD